MRGSNERRTALAAIALGVIVTTGAASAAPVDVLRASDGSSQCVAPLAEGGAFTYSYIQSMYEVPVVEDLVRDGGRIRVLRIRSSEMRAVEYYRWDGDSHRQADGLWEQEAPPNDHAALVIRIAPLGQQRISTAHWSIEMLPRFGDTVVTVRVEQRPRAVTLLATSP